MVDVSIILINFNTLGLTLQCIKSLYDHNEGFTYEIILIDNASDEFNQDIVLAKYPEIRIIKNEKNIGFSKANNQGIEQSKGEYILLLNNDTELVENSIKKCLDALRTNKKIGVVSPRLIYPDGSPQHSVNAYPSITNELIELLRITKVLSPKRLSERYLGRFYDYSQSGDVPWVWGTFFMFSKDILQKLSGGRLYDEFFMYYEDVYWCYQFRSAGFSVYFHADTQVVHHLSQSLLTISGRKNNLIVDNEWKFVRKYKGIFYAFFYFAIKAFVLLTQRQVHLRKLGAQYLRKIFL